MRYSFEEYRSLLDECGFREVRFYPNLRGDDQVEAGLLVITCTRE